MVQKHTQSFLEELSQLFLVLHGGVWKCLVVRLFPLLIMHDYVILSFLYQFFSDNLPLDYHIFYTVLNVFNLSVLLVSIYLICIPKLVSKLWDFPRL